MASIRDIKRRRGSIAGTQQITRAMKLVSTVKLQRARARAESTKPYFEWMYDTIAAMAGRSGNADHPYLQNAVSQRKAVIVITSNRGLAGGYHSNVVKLVTEDERFEKETTEIYALGKKGRDIFASGKYSTVLDFSEKLSAPLYRGAAELGEILLKKFEKGEIGEIYLAYTVFQNAVTQVPMMRKLLPVDIRKNEGEADSIPMSYEPDEATVLGVILPKYLGGLIYGAMMEAAASENGARMQAMDLATGNAEEMLRALSLDYNRARQGMITQELTEIIAGAQAIH